MENDWSGLIFLAVLVFVLAILIQVVIVVVQIAAWVVAFLTITGLLLATFGGLGVGGNLFVRALVGLWVHRAGRRKKLARARAFRGLMVMYLAPVVATIVLALVSRAIEPLAPVLVALVGLISLPAYYWAWFTETIPLVHREEGEWKIRQHRGIDLPFRSEPLMRAEEKLALGRLLMRWRYLCFRLRLFFAGVGGDDGHL